MSSEQKFKVVSKTQTANPLYLKTLLEVNDWLLRLSIMVLIVRMKCGQNKNNVAISRKQFSRSARAMKTDTNVFSARGLRNNATRRPIILTTTNN